ncbi:hypothetical protein LCGC14_0761340 [marine sediment metagenome]|uniref:Uncharacterized protein n=1 Tax=marine sediment metagenome TaxID=412755 RepID=A0A0F9T823_9ZZZZ
MNYERDWNDNRNAVGFAVECARLALPFYGGDRRSDVVAAIEIAEGCVNDEPNAHRGARAAACAARAAIARAAATSGDDRAAASAATYTALAAYDAIADITSDGTHASYAACDAGHAGVDSGEIQIAFARWVIRDLSCGRNLDEELRQAAGAAVVAGDEALAQELLQ